MSIKLNEWYKWRDGDKFQVLPFVVTKIIKEDDTHIWANIKELDGNEGGIRIAKNEIEKDMILSPNVGIKIMIENEVKEFSKG